jgi:hypothetical protein
MRFTASGYKIVDDDSFLTGIACICLNLQTVLQRQSGFQYSLYAYFVQKNGQFNRTVTICIK